MKQNIDVLLGLQWGDEGKGKVVDVLTPRYDIVARFQGGPNAGHTLEFEGKKYVLRSIPSGIFQHGQVNIIGNGVVLDPVLFREEAESLCESGVNLKSVLKISKKAHLIMPTHRLLDAATEASPIPVFPLVGSTMVAPSVKSPIRSASSTIVNAARSLTLPAGLKYSSLAMGATGKPPYSA